MFYFKFLLFYTVAIKIKLNNYSKLIDRKSCLITREIWNVLNL